MTRVAHQNHTVARVKVLTDDAVIYGYASPSDRVFGGRTQTLHAGRDVLVGGIVAVSTSKPLAGDTVGSWQVTTTGYVYGDRGARGATWTSLVSDGDWISIDVVKNGRVVHVMQGRIDSLALDVSADGSGAVRTVLVLKGRDTTAAPVDTPVHFNPYDPLHNNAAGIDMVRMFGEAFAGPPHVAVPRIVTQALGDNAANFGHPARVPAGVFSVLPMRWVDGLDIVARVAACRGFLFAPSLLNAGQQQSVWKLAQQHANPVLNELWIDTDPDAEGPFGGRVAYLNMRERPFVNRADGLSSPWYKLALHVVPVSTVQRIAVERGKNRVNYVQLSGAFAATFGGDAMALAPPAYHEASIARWGLRMMEVSSTYLSDESSGGAGNWTSENRQWRDLVVAWNALNPLYWEGTITLAELRPEIRVGSRVALVNGPPAGYPDFPTDEGDVSRAMTWYVESVTHSWTAGEAPQRTTTLGVTRGYVEARRWADLSAELSQWRDVVGSAGGRDASTLDDYPAGDPPAPGEVGL